MLKCKTFNFLSHNRASTNLIFFNHAIFYILELLISNMQKKSIDTNIEMIKTLTAFRNFELELSSKNIKILICKIRK